MYHLPDSHAPNRQTLLCQFCCSQISAVICSILSATVVVVCFCWGKAKLDICKFFIVAVICHLAVTQKSSLDESWWRCWCRFARSLLWYMRTLEVGIHSTNYVTRHQSGLDSYSYVLYDRPVTEVAEVMYTNSGLESKYLPKRYSPTGRIALWIIYVSWNNWKVHALKCTLNTTASLRKQYFYSLMLLIPWMYKSRSNFFQQTVQSKIMSYKFKKNIYLL